MFIFQFNLSEQKKFERTKSMELGQNLNPQYPYRKTHAVQIESIDAKDIASKNKYHFQCPINNNKIYDSIFIAINNSNRYLFLYTWFY